MPHSTTVINRRPPVPEIIQPRSLTDFHLQGELSSNGGMGGVLGVTDTFSFAAWTEMPTSNIFGQQWLWTARPTAGGFGNSIQFGTESNGGTGPPDHFEVQIQDNTSSFRQRLQWHFVWTPGTNSWKHVVYTWDGTVSGSKLYVDGVDQGAPDSIFNNLDGSTIVDVSRDILIGGNLTGLNTTWTGPVYSAGLYDKVLSQAEVTYMYNNGDPTTLDLETNYGAYQGANNLLHYYRVGLGTDDTDFGLDRGVGSPLINLDNANITTGFLTEETPVSTGRYWGFRSSNISLLQKDSAALGISDEHTMLIWMRRKGTFYSRAIFDSAEANTVSNRRLLLHNNANELQYELRGPAGSSSASLVLSYQIDDLPTSGVSVPWEQFVFVYDGTNAGDNDLDIYWNANLLTEGAGSGIGDPYIFKVNDGNPNQTDTSVNTAVGGPVNAGFGSMWEGEIYHVAIWDTQLSAAEITALYAGGSPAELDLSSDFGDYASSANLVHWWTWEDEGDRGADYGSGSINLLDDANASPGFEDNGNQIWWSLAEYPGSPGDSTTG